MCEKIDTLIFIYTLITLVVQYLQRRSWKAHPFCAVDLRQLRGIDAVGAGIRFSPLLNPIRFSQEIHQLLYLKRCHISYSVVSELCAARQGLEKREWSV